MEVEEQKESVEMQNRTLDAQTGDRQDNPVADTIVRKIVDKIVEWNPDVKIRAPHSKLMQIVPADIASTSDWQDRLCLISPVCPISRRLAQKVGELAHGDL